MRKLVLSAFFWIALPLASVPGEANAKCLCEVWSPVAIAAISKAAALNIAAIAADAGVMVAWIETRIVPTWASGFGKLRAEKQRQTASFRVFGEGRLAVDTQFYMQEQAAIAAERAVPPANLATTIINGAMLGEQTGIVREKIAASDALLMTDFYVTNSADPNVVIERHRPYCSQAYVDGGRCDKVAAATMQNADLMVNTVLNPGEGQYETLSDEERDAALAFVMNVINPVPMSRLSA